MPQPGRKPRQPSFEYYKPAHIVLAMAQDESEVDMDAALARIGIDRATVTYLSMASVDDLESPQVDAMMKELKQRHGELSVVIEPMEHYVKGMSGRWPVGKVNDEMYAWKAKTVRHVLSARQQRAAISYGAVEHE